MGMFTLGIISMESRKGMVNITGRISHSSKVISSNFDSCKLFFNVVKMNKNDLTIFYQKEWLERW